MAFLKQNCMCMKYNIIKSIVSAKRPAGFAIRFPRLAKANICFAVAGLCFMLFFPVFPGALSSFPSQAYGQELKLQNYNTDNAPTLRWIYGISFGGYFAHPSTARYYDGSGKHSDGEHAVESALNRHYNRDRLIANVEEIIETFEIGELPQNMRYDPGLLIGFFGGFTFSRSFALMGEFNYTRLTAADKFTIITDKFTSTSEPFRLLSDIYGVEERIELRLGFQYTLYTSSYIHPFIESGLNITDTKIIENRVNVSGIQFNIREIRSEIYGIRDYGMGFGIYTGAGLNFEVSDSFSFRLGGSVSLSQINLGLNNEIKPQYNIFLRLNLHEILRGS